MPSESQARPASHQKDEAQPKVSCLRCRDQKLKCSRELPSCVRCSKQNVDCTYPAPPDRRRIAQRTSEMKASEALSNSTEQPNQRRALAETKSSKRQRTKSEEYIFVAIPSPCRSSDTFDSDVSDVADLPSTEIGLLLLEVYFKRVYNASLLFHKAVIFDLYRQDGIPEYLLRAIFAHAAVFLQNVETTHKDRIKTFSMHKIFERSWSWARSASKEVLSSADEPTLTRIQALQVLQLYYFSRGDSKRSKIHLSLAYQLSQLLEYSNLREDVAPTAITQHMMFDREMKRRCFWAVWCSVSLGEPLENFKDIRDGVTGLPLPAKFDTSGLMKGRGLSLGQRMMFEWESNPQSMQALSVTDGSSSYSLMSVLVKFLGVWMNVKEFISELPSLPPSKTTGQFERLVTRADSIHRSSGLTITNLSSRAKFYNESPEMVVSVYSAYLLSQLLLHTSMVAKLARVPVEPFETKELAQRCSKMVLEYASTFAKLSQRLLDEELDLTRLWPLTGYLAFIVGNVFTVYRNKMLQGNNMNTSQRIPGPGSGEMKAVQTVLEVSGVFWKPLRDYTAELKKAISSKSARDLDTIITLTYPWGVAPIERSSETPEDITSFDYDSSTLLLQNQSPHTLLSFDEIPVQPSSHQATGHENFQFPAGQQQHLPTITHSGGSFPEPFDFEYQAPEEDIFMYNSGRNTTFETHWWDVVSTDDTLSYTQPLTTHTSNN